MDIDPYLLYCSLRNYLRKQNLDDSLLAIHAHIEFQQFGIPLPTYVKGTPPGYRNVSSFQELANYHIFPWEIAILYREVLLNSQPYDHSHSLLDWHYLSEAVNKLKFLEEELSKQYSSRENVLLELFRISHRQFKWQKKAGMDAPARYWKIFSLNGLDSIIKNEIGITLEDIIIIGMALLGLYQEKIALFYPSKYDLPGINQEKFDIFLSHFCIDYKVLKDLISSEQRYDDRYAYSYSSLVAYPLIRKEWLDKQAILCPIPRYLYERITDGLYYEVCQVNGFDHSFGDAFQAYVGDVLSSFYKRGHIYSEEKYGKNNRTVDWVVDDSDSMLFIECKTKRLKNKAKVDLFNIAELDSELTKLADAVVQVYKTMQDYQKGLYPTVAYCSEKTVFPVIVTLENWYIFGDLICNKLNEIIIDKLCKLKLPASLIITNPYCVVSIETLEKLIFIANIRGVKAIIKTGEKQTWEYDSYLWNTFTNEIQNASCPFVAELNTKIDEILENN